MFLKNLDRQLHSWGSWEEEEYLFVILSRDSHTPQYTLVSVPSVYTGRSPVHVKRPNMLHMDTDIASPSSWGNRVVPLLNEGISTVFQRQPRWHPSFVHDATLQVESLSLVRSVCRTVHDIFVFLIWFLRPSLALSLPKLYYHFHGVLVLTSWSSSLSEMQPACSLLRWYPDFCYVYHARWNGRFVECGAGLGRGANECSHVHTCKRIRQCMHT